MDPSYEVILAHQMNGEDIPVEHGYPLRLIVPGCIGVRSCKWVCELEVSTEEADSAPQRRDYKIVKDKEMTTVKWDEHEALYGNVLNSAIAYPGDNDKDVALSADGTVEIKGWALGNGTHGS